MKKLITGLLNSFIKLYGYEITLSRLLYDWQKLSSLHAKYNETILPKGAEDYLQDDNPRLIELRKKYSTCNPEVIDHTLWGKKNLKSIDIKYFRGDNAFVWQARGKNMSPLNYTLTTYYVKNIDGLNLLEKLTEDEYFGAITFLVNNKIISRDLLDSIVEIYFLEKTLNISKMKDLNILDIGAGYGRLAHRMVKCLPNINYYFCTDAVYVSTFISEYYLHVRNVDHKAMAIPLYAIEDTLKEHRIDIAINVHSFSECKSSAINWWLSLLKKHKVKYLMIVPNAFDNGGKLLRTYDRQDFSKLIKKAGYKLIAKNPKYRDSAIQVYGVNPTYHYLFELR